MLPYTRRLLPLVAAVVAACASSPAERLTTRESRPEAMEFCRQAHALWLDAHLRGGESKRDEYIAALEKLADAESRDPRIPLFPGLAGDVNLMLASEAHTRDDGPARQDHVEAAKLAFERALADPNWVHGHLGLARIHREAGRFDEAEAHVTRAGERLAVVLQPDERGPNLAERLLNRLMGIDLRPAPERADPIATVPTEEQSRRLLLNYLGETERWTVSFAPSPTSKAGTAVDDRDLLLQLVQRMRLEGARIELGRALEIAGGEPGAVRGAWQAHKQRLDEWVLTNARDFPEAQLEHAEALLRIGDSAGALRGLNYLMQGERFSILAQNTALQGLVLELEELAGQKP